MVGRWWSERSSCAPERSAGARPGLRALCVVTAGRRRPGRGQKGEPGWPWIVWPEGVVTALDAGTARSSENRVKVTKNRSARTRVTDRQIKRPTPKPKLRPETISAGRWHSCGLDTAGKAWCWGLAQGGRVGDGTGDRGLRLSPVAVLGGHTFLTR